MENIKKFIPGSLIEALTILSNRHCYIVAGGTDILVQKRRKSGLLPAFYKDILFIDSLDELHFIKDIDGELHIGATVKYYELLDSDLVPQLLKDIVLDIASPNIRNMATIVGNIANASPAGDTLVGLYLLDARVEISSIRGNRQLSISDFILGVRSIDLKEDEMITSLIIPKHDFTSIRWKKVGSRAAESISKISFGGAYSINKGVISDFRLCFGAVNSTVVRKKDIENKYIGLQIDTFISKVDTILNDYASFIHPIDDQRSNKKYRFKVAMNIARDFILSIKKV